MGRNTNSVKRGQKRNTVSLLFWTMVMLFGLFSCTYDNIVHEDIVIPENVSFSTDIIPVFEAKCSTSGCHDPGNIPPDLSAENAYINLSLFGYLDTSDPENSGLYKAIDYGGKMENYASDNDRSLILKWIQQGAQNN